MTTTSHPIATAGMNAPAPDSRKRRTVMLALVHVALAVGILALFVFMQTHKG